MQGNKVDPDQGSNPWALAHQSGTLATVKATSLPVVTDTRQNACRKKEGYVMLDERYNQANSDRQRTWSTGTI